MRFRTDPLALISPTRSSRATLRQALSCSRAGRSAISVIMPTMTELVLRMPRNLPTVAFDASVAAAAGLRPTVTCAPVTAWTRPITFRLTGAALGAGARGAGAGGGSGAEAAAGAGAGGGADGGGVIGCRSSGDGGCRVKVESIATPGLEDFRSCRGTALPRHYGSNAGDFVKLTCHNFGERQFIRVI